MTQLRCTLFALLGLTLAACGSDDPTVVALNISYGDGISRMDTVRVSFVQGSEKVSDSFKAPTNTETVTPTLPDGGQGEAYETQVPDNQYFKRYELPNFSSGEAELTVQLLAANSVLYTEKTTFEVLKNRTVAAYAAFEATPPAPGSSGETSAPPPVDAGVDAGATDETSGVSTAPVSSSADSSSAPSDGGVDDAGEPADAGDASTGNSSELVADAATADAG